MSIFGSMFHRSEAAPAPEQAPVAPATPAPESPVVAQGTTEVADAMKALTTDQPAAPAVEAAPAPMTAEAAPVTEEPAAPVEEKAHKPHAHKKAHATKHAAHKHKKAA